MKSAKKINTPIWAIVYIDFSRCNASHNIGKTNVLKQIYQNKSKIVEKITAHYAEANFLADTKFIAPIKVGWLPSVEVVK